MRKKFQAMIKEVSRLGAEEVKGRGTFRCADLRGGKGVCGVCGRGPFLNKGVFVFYFYIKCLLFLCDSFVFVVFEEVWKFFFFFPRA